MKKLLLIGFLLIGISAFCAEKTRQFDADGKPLAFGKIGVYQLVCATDTEWNNSGCPDNVKLENGAVRFKTAEEKQADVLTAQQAAILKETVFGKLEIREVFESIIIQESPKQTLGDVLNQVLDSNSKFKDYWADADKGIDLTYPMVADALASFPVQLDINALKLLILQNRMKKAQK